MLASMASMPSVRSYVYGISMTIAIWKPKDSSSRAGCRKSQRDGGNSKLDSTAHSGRPPGQPFGRVVHADVERLDEERAHRCVLVFTGAVHHASSPGLRRSSSPSP